MTTHHHITLPLLVALAWSVGGSVAQAMERTPTPAAGAAVDSRPASGYDIRALCPGIDAALQDALAPAWDRVQRTGVLRVQMQLDGRHLDEVSTSGGPRRYDHFVKRAVEQLSCDAGDGRRQTVRFEVEFRDPDSQASRDMVASASH